MPAPTRFAIVCCAYNERRDIEQKIENLLKGLSNLLAELAPGDLNTTKFEGGGAEVTEAAIKIARQYHKLTGNPGKYKVLSRYLSWHGSTMGSLAASGLKGRKTVNEPLPAGFGVVEDDHRVLAAELELQLDHPRADVLRDPRAEAGGVGATAYVRSARSSRSPSNSRDNPTVHRGAR